MLHFENDYVLGACQKVLQALIDTNEIKMSGYTHDDYHKVASEKIKKACGIDSAQVYFLTGGTQTNAIVIDAMLAPCEGVLSVDTGHINILEAGAIEYTGRKIITLQGENGKFVLKDLEQYLDDFFKNVGNDHMVRPGMVYISLPTELGTLYSKCELQKLYSICKKFNIKLFIDGARLGYGLMSPKCDLDLRTVAENCDIFYLGGTKIGALCGEAVVFTKNNMPEYFLSFVKQHGALLAKSRLISVQFDALFTDDLYFDLSRHAIKMAMKLKNILQEKGYKFFVDSFTNQQFIIVDNRKMKKIAEKVKFSIWKKLDEDNTVIRFVTSWSTTQEDIEKLEEIL